MSKIKILVENGNFGRKWKFLVENGNFGRKWTFLVENGNFGQNGHFLVENRFVMVENRNVGRKSKFWSKTEIWVEMEILIKNQSFGQIWTKNQNSVTNRNFRQKYKMKIEILIEIECIFLTIFVF